MIVKALKFLDKVFSQLEVNQIELGDWKIDHICYRTTSAKNYSDIKKIFEPLGECLVESEVNGRQIASYKLHEPIIYKNHTIEVVEVPAPKSGKVTLEGFEHIEVVVDIGFDEIQNRFPNCKFNTLGMGKALNPELEIELIGCAIKFHHQTLEEVIRIEKAQNKIDVSH